MKDPAARFEVLTALNIQVEIFWVVTSCSIVVGYKISVVPEGVSMEP